jgi:tetratricopeptide (TPR) repeat protein
LYPEDIVKIPPRIAAPLLLALGAGILIGGLFLWQIHRSVATIEGSFNVNNSSGLLRKILPGSRTVANSAMQSQALMELRQGEIFELKGEWKQAQDKYSASVTSGGGTPALKKLASIQLQRREYDAAAETIDALKRENKDSEDVLLLEGILALRKGDMSTALSIFKRKPDSPQGLYGQSLVAIVENDSTQAKELLTKAAQAGDPAIRGIANSLLDAYNEFALFPNGEPIHLATLLARGLAQVNECETALKLVTPVITTQPRYRDAWIVKGFCEFTTERTKDALTSLEQAYSLDPEKPEIQYFLARTHAALGDPQNAVTFLQYAILNGFTPERDARELLADYARELGNTALALEQYKLIAEGRDGDLEAYGRYIDLAVGTPNHGLDALDLAKSALKKWPDDATALTLAAKAALAAGLPDEAQRYVETALRIDPKSKEAQAVQEAIRKSGSAQ